MQRASTMAYHHAVTALSGADHTVYDRGMFMKKPEPVTRWKCAERSSYGRAVGTRSDLDDLEAEDRRVYIED